jgi:hypothetical protein
MSRILSSSQRRDLGDANYSGGETRDINESVCFYIC